jgi:uncharacterized protein involved in exopolysaccharide biosynthesis
MSAPLPLFPLLPQPESEADSAIGLTPRDLLRQVFKYWTTVAVCLFTVTGLTVCGLSVQPAVYEASAKVLIQTEQQGTPSFLSGITAYRDPQDPEPQDRKIETEIQLLMSRSNAQAVVQRLGITKAMLIQPPLEYLKVLLPPFVRGAAKPKTAAELQTETVTLFLKALTVEPLRSKTADTTSNVFEAHFACADKNLAPRALAALLQEYIRFGTQHNRELGEATFRLVDAKAREVADELQGLDDRIQVLTVRHASRPDVSAGGSTGDSSASLPNPRNATQNSLALLKTEAIEMQAKLEDARQSFTDDSPTVKHLTEQLHELEGRLRSGAQASAQLDTEIERLERRRALTVERFKELRTKRDQIELYLQLNPVVSDTRVVTEPPVPPEMPNIKIKLIVGLMGPILGLLIGLVIAGVREYFDHRLENAGDIKRYLGLDTLAIVPREPA